MEEHGCSAAAHGSTPHANARTTPKWAAADALMPVPVLLPDAV
jgi:hypothetical protein